MLGGAKILSGKRVNVAALFLAAVLAFYATTTLLSTWQWAEELNALDKKLKADELSIERERQNVDIKLRKLYKSFGNSSIIDDTEDEEEEEEENEENEGTEDEEEQEENNQENEKQQQPKQKENIKGSNLVGVADRQKQLAIREAMAFCWQSYKKVWGQDELRPISGGVNNWMDLGLSIVDSMDTLFLMNLEKEFEEGKRWIEKDLSFEHDRFVSLFETTIRVLGGLITCYEQTQDRMFLEKAIVLGTKFLPVFNTPSGIPLTQINLKTGVAMQASWTGGASLLSEVGTLQLEMIALSKHSNNPIYREKALKVFDAIAAAPKSDGLFSVYISPQTGAFTQNHVTLGALGDSYYEYLLKVWLLTGEEKYKDMYFSAINVVKEKLVKKSTPNGFTYIAEMIGGRLNHKMDHLVCFAGAMFDLDGENQEIGLEITKTCNEMYVRQSTGIAPELVEFGQNDFYTPGSARHYLLRPETVEAIFVSWRVTHDKKYREWGWKIFEAINKHCRFPGGFSGIRDVNSVPTQPDDLQQSFFMAETLKYLYLLFSDDSLIPLDQYVFNTEAHPIRRF